MDNFGRERRMRIMIMAEEIAERPPVKRGTVVEKSSWVNAVVVAVVAAVAAVLVEPVILLVNLSLLVGSICSLLVCFYKLNVVYNNAVFCETLILGPHCM